MVEDKLLKEEITSYYPTKGAKRVISTLLSPLLQVSDASEDSEECFLTCKLRDVIPVEM